MKTLDMLHQPAAVPAWSPDGKRLAYTAGDNHPNVYVIDAQGGAPRRINPPTHGGMLPFWFSDGKRIGYTRTTPAQDKAQKDDRGIGVFRGSEDGNSKTRLTPAGVDCLSGDWSRTR